MAIRQRPDLIVLDILMPVMGGFEVLKLLKAKKETTMIPVIMLTAIDNDEAKDKAAGLYIEDYIVKPVSMMDLRAKVESVLARRI